MLLYVTLNVLFSRITLAVIYDLKFKEALSVSIECPKISFDFVCYTCPEVYDEDNVNLNVDRGAFVPGLPDFSWCMIPKPEKCTK
jgi:hypothetical protein